MDWWILTVVSLVVLGVGGFLIEQEIKYRKHLQVKRDKEICDRFERDDLP